TNIYNKASKRDLPYRAIGIDISPINIKNIDSNYTMIKKICAIKRTSYT
ncbi:hypothetical protein BER46_003909, partial [Clostridioides difficile]